MFLSTVLDKKLPHKSPAEVGCYEGKLEVTQETTQDKKIGIVTLIIYS
jgi:hypothetical protein